MIPKTLKIKGIYSYQKTQEINFQTLTKNGIFGIFGSVGSGKSTILEAITFALFSQTERLSSVKKKGYNMINLRSKSILIDFEFFDNQENLWRSTVKAKRNSKDFSKSPAFEKQLYKFEGDNWVPKDQRIEDIIGLNYKNFKRTVIIPQGKFSEFLTLDPSERTQMLKEIFSLEKYDLYENASKIERQTQEKFIRIEERLNILGEINYQDIEINERKLSELKKHKKIKDEEIEIIKKEHQNLEKHKEKFDRLKTLQVESKLLEEKENEFKLLEENLNLFSKVQMVFAKIIQKYDDLNSEASKIANDGKVLKSSKESLQKQFDEVNLKLIELEKTRKLIPDYQNQLKIIGDEISAKKIFESFEAIISNINELSNEILEIEKRITEFESKKQEVEEILKSKRVHSNSLQKLLKIKSWFETKKIILDEIHVKNESVSILKEELRSILSVKGNNYSSLEKIKKSILNLENTYKSNILEIKQLEKTIEKSTLLLSQNEIAQSLKSGDKCPICGSKDHPEKMSHSNLNIELNKLKLKKSKFEKENEVLLKEIENLKISMKEVEIKSDLLENEEKFLKKYSDKLQEHDTKFIWSDFSKVAENEVLKEIENVERSNIEIEKNEISLENLNSKILQETQKLDQLKKSLKALEIKKSGLDGSLKELTKNSTISTAELKQTTTEELIAKEAEIQKVIEAVEEDYQKYKNEHLELSNKLSSIDGSLNQMREHYLQKSSKIKALSGEIKEKLENEKFESEEFVREILTREMNVEKSTREINDFKLKFGIIKEEINSLITEVKNLDFDENKLEDKKQKLTIEEESLEIIKKEITTLENKIAADKSAFLEKEKFLNTKQEIEIRLENIKLLRNLFIGQRFVSYVSTIFLENLCSLANKRFRKLTRNSLQLEIDETNSFVVRDFLNDGHVRHIKTLSGGQIFQASLSLALALSESIQSQIKAKQNFFFIDEGFGSLDKDSLDSVIETLMSLKKEGRIVGIISHVDDLQKEINSYLHVSKDDQDGSRIDQI